MTVLTDEIFDKILDDLFETPIALPKILEKHKITRKTFYKHIKDKNKGEDYARAHDSNLENAIEELDDMILSAKNEDIQKLRLLADTRKWYISKRLPNKYGDKVVHSGSVSHNLFIAGAERRASKIVEENPIVIEGSVEEN